MKTNLHSTYDIIVDAEQLVRTYPQNSLTLTPSGKLVYKFERYGRMLYSPVTNTCIKTRQSYNSAQILNAMFKKDGLTSCMYRVN